jgi:chromosome segregation ATPase
MIQKDNAFKIEELKIKKYFTEEYEGLRHVLGKKSLFVHGTNNTGKTTSFDATMFAIFGSEFVDRPLSSLDDTEIVLANSETTLTIARKYHTPPQLRIQKNNNSARINGVEAVDKCLYDLFNLPRDPKIGKLLIHSLVVPQRGEDTILTKRSYRELETIILTFCGGIKEIARFSEINSEINIREQKLDTFDRNKRSIYEDVRYLKLGITQNKKYAEEMKEFLSQYESKKLFETAEALNKQKILMDKLNKLYSRKSGLRDKLIKINKEIGDLEQFYNRRLTDVVKETLSVLVCPVCGENLPLDKIESRKSRALCPFCGREHYSGSLYSILKQQIDESNSRLDPLKKDRGKIKKEIDEAETQINEVKHVPEFSVLSKFNHIIIKVIGECNNKIEFENKYNEHKDKYNKFSAEFKKINEEIQVKEKYVSEIERKEKLLRDEISELEKEKQILKETRINEELKEFESILNNVFKELVGHTEGTLKYTDGKIYLCTTSERNCSNKNDISYSQKKLIDIALWATLHYMNAKHERINLRFGLIDDIFMNIDDAELSCKTNLINFLGTVAEKLQIVVFSIDEELNQRLLLEEVHKLELSPHTQYQQIELSFNGQKI